MDIQQFGVITHPISMKYQHLSHKSHPCELINALFMKYKNHNPFSNRTLYFISIEQNVMLVKPKGKSDGNGDQFTVPKFL